MFSEGIRFICRGPDVRRPLLTMGLLLTLVASTMTPHAALAQSAEGEASASSTSTTRALPPLPSIGPQIGPIIDPGLQDDVERRTTAFIPRDLSMLTPIEDMPVDVDRWIRVDLSEQILVAYEGNQPIRAFVVSTGLPATPTVTGRFNVRVKVRSQTMSGGDPALGTYYNLTNVEWVQYFYADYGIHGTYWHNNFGNPMSHGCVNMTNADAKWLFDWASPTWDGQTIWYSSTADDPGTLVIVHH